MSVSKRECLARIRELSIQCREQQAEIERLKVELQSSRVAARGLADECDRQREQIAAMRQIHDEDPV